MNNAQTIADARLEFCLADAMRKALDVSGLSVQQMAADLEVSRNTISAWINGRNVPRRRDLRDFALRTGVPLEWLMSFPVHPPGLEPGTHCFRHGRLACWACDGAEEPYPNQGPLAIVTAMPTRGIASSPQWGDAA